LTAPASHARRIILFIERFCRVPEGALVGQPIKLAEFQKDFIRAVYDNEDENGECRTRRAYLSIARKNAKSALIACIMLAHLVGPERRLNSQIISGARSRDQAALIFKLAVKMIQLSPELAKIVRIVPSTKQIFGLVSNTEYRALAADGTKAHGLSPVLAILDEVGQIRGPQDDFVDAITSSQGAHDAPLLIAISTQAPTDADLFSIWLDDAERSEDPTIISHVYAAPDDCELDDEEAWRAANPALGLFRSLEDVQNQAAQALRMPSAENTFRNLILNQRVNLASPFVSASVWKAGNRDTLPFENFPVFGGLDLSMTTDLTALVLVCRIDGELHVRAFFWIPRDSLRDAAKRDRAPYELWEKQGFLRTTPGKVIDYSFIAADIAKITAGLNLQMIAFDRFRMDRLKAELERAEVTLPLKEFGQGFVSMAPALDALEADLLQDRVRHGGHPALAMCAANAVAVMDAAGNRKLEKSKSTGRIDGIVALTMASGIEATQSPGFASPYDDPTFSLFA
jgi:phage terminase large subunit-like protein